MDIILPLVSTRQLHCDTPHQKTPPLFAAFIALQDVEVAMGPTMFLPGTHLRASPQRHAYDQDRTGGLGKCDAMLASFAAPRFAQLNAGDLVLFDMRILHAGTTNQLDTGRQRLMLCTTFRNPAANECTLGHKPCIRPAYVEQITLKNLRSEKHMTLLGDGLPEYASV
jgi:ectoine hydroxylase-related dioxygenase (phytanoyl-CoA dioxygenase family)